jgi:hypothetical protein
MKLILVLSTFLSLNAFAQVVISEKTVTLPIDLSTAKLKLSSRGYSNLIVKVLVPELADVTLGNHRNEDEEAPCLATYETRDPEDVIQGKPEKIFANFKITLVKTVLADSENNICHVTLSEQISGEIRGFEFFHERSIPLPERDLEDCR